MCAARGQLRSSAPPGCQDAGDEEGGHGPHITLVFIGPFGCGKSTTAGHLIADCDAIDQQSLERITREATERGQEDRRYAWILDKLRSERERGGTTFMALWRLTSQRCRFLIIDAPGHNDFEKDTVTAMSQADIAVLVVTAVQADLDVGNACEGQIREHTLLAYTLGVRRLVVCVNKMDSDAVAYSQEHFERACAVVREDLQNVGYATERVLFVPTSGLVGDNITRASERMQWYKGPTLLEALHHVVASNRQPERPLRIPLREVYQIGGTGVIATGRIETGSLRPGIRLVLMPGNVLAQVQSIEMHHERLDLAVAGDNVNVVVDVPMKDLHRGMVGSDASVSPARECLSFLAQVIVLSLPRAGEIRAGCVLMVDCHTAQVPCVFEELLQRTDRRTGKVLEMRPDTLQAGDAAVVRFRPQAPMCVEPFADYPPLGRFAVRDQKTTVAVGVVQQVETAPPPSFSPSAKAPAPRARMTSKPHLSVKPKVHPSLSTAVIEQDNADTADDDGLDTSPKKSLAAFPATSPFAAFGAVTRGKAKEAKWRSRPEDVPSDGSVL